MNTHTASQRGNAVLIGVIVVAVLALGIWAFTGRSDDAKMMPSPSAMMEKSPSPSVMMKKEEGAMMTNGKVLEYTKEAYDRAVADGQVVALYFYANWCPICKVGFPKFESAVQALTSAKLTAFRVNWSDSDTSADETAAAKTFQVGSQHTLVIVKNGVGISKESVGTTSAQEYQDKLTSAIK